jgi:hypothetical protein
LSLSKLIRRASFNSINKWQTRSKTSTSIISHPNRNGSKLYHLFWSQLLVFMWQLMFSSLWSLWQVVCFSRSCYFLKRKEKTWKGSKLCGTQSDNFSPKTRRYWALLS